MKKEKTNNRNIKEKETWEKDQFYSTLVIVDPSYNPRFVIGQCRSSGRLARDEHLLAWGAGSISRSIFFLNSFLHDKRPARF